MWSRRTPTQSLLFGCRLLCRGFFSSLLFRFSGCRFHFFVRFRSLLYLFFFLGKLGGLEGLAVEGDLGDADGAEVLAVSAELLVLLFAFVMEDEDLGAASLLDDLAGHARFAAGAHDAARFRRDGEHIAELDLAVGSIYFFHPDDISRGNLVLLTTCADHRVHKSSRTLVGRTIRRPSGALAALKLVLLAVFSAAVSDRERGA